MGAMDILIIEFLSSNDEFDILYQPIYINRYIYQSTPNLRLNWYKSGIDGFRSEIKVPFIKQ